MAELNLRTSAATAIKRIHGRVLEASHATMSDVFQLEQELRSLASHFERFSINHNNLVGAAKKEELESHDMLWEQIEDLYDEACCILNRLIASTKSASDENESMRTCPTADTVARAFELKLDPLAIPSFDGSMHNWLAFKDAFETLVHRSSYPEAFKLGKLRQAVNANTVPLIGGVYSGGYEEVWQALKQRFDNKKQLAEIHVSRFLDLPLATEETTKSLLAVVDTVHESLRALRVMDVPVDKWDALAVPIVISKLPAATKRDWCMSCSSNEIPLLEDLLKFLEKRAHSLCSGVVPFSTAVRQQQRSVKSHVVAIEEGKCAHCHGAHRITRCPNLTALRPEQRFEVIKKSKLCYNCLKAGHSSKQCSSGGCRNCGRPPTVAYSSRANPIILLATACVFANGNGSVQRLARILCDPGSQVSFVTDRLANYLQLQKKKFEIDVEGIGAITNARTKGSVMLTLKSTYSEFEVPVEALVLSSITSVTPAVHVDIKQWKHLVGLELADIHFGTPGIIDVLIGADIWGRIVEGSIIGGRPDEPCAQRTRFGWVVFGPASVATHSALPSLALNAQLCDDDVSLEDLLRNFWRLEEVPVVEDGDDGECGRIFSSTHSRTLEGRYVVQLPLRRDAPKLGDSYAHAIRQFSWLERRLSCDSELREKYIKFMREYATLGHMEHVDQPGNHTSCYYIPHHAVTSKFRVVFNASARTSTGVSLNDIQLVGPTIQDSLINIIFRFRRYPVAITADIEKMFRQVELAPIHRDYQRIIWRESPTDNIGVYRLNTVTYGMACSPYNAVRALNQCAYDNYNNIKDVNQGSLARDAILTSFYVDDFLTSCDSVSIAVNLARSVDNILSAGKFQLRKWQSNNSQVITQLTGNTYLTTELSINPPTASVIGLKWDSATDQLFFHVQLKPTCQSPTKRRVLSEVAQLFDPTGILAPVVIAGKVFIQRMWSAGLNWDTPLPLEIRDDWLIFRERLETLNQIRIPRWAGMRDGKPTSLHGFCDASLQAYAAVIYTKTTDEDGNVLVSLLTARTKVAPLKGATIPRLELCAAQLLAITLQNVRVALSLTDSPYYLWSDSAIVLCWLRKQPTVLKPYISNRVRQIQELTSPDRWHHVRSAQNPADCASRGISPDELLKHPLWWHGPEWLGNDSYPMDKTVNLSKDESDDAKNEERILSCIAIPMVKHSLETRRLDGEVIPLVERFSSIQRLLHTVAIILRWTPSRRHLRQSVIGARELENAMEALILLEQRNVFGAEIKQLTAGADLSYSSRLLPLNPYLDDKGILRVGGRINKAALPHHHRCPIILPKSGSLVHLLIQQAHDNTLHGGTQLMLQTLRSRFWILHARQAVKSFVHNCVVCRRYRGATLMQQMASLPGKRVTPSRPFSSSGVDYCGPFVLRIGTKRSRTTTKTYLAIFVCMATKAVHIEVVDDLSSQAFLEAFTRFISRRGPCSDLYSDNGTAFVGANRLLQQDLAAWHNENNQQSLANVGTHWHFITPSAPHQGGLWEAAVKSAKRHLIRVVGAQAMWHSQLRTLAARIEACLNSRPITPLYDDPDDKFALTPGDFLVGAPLLAVPEPDIRQVPANRLKQWQWVQQVHQEFWHRWSDEYLATLQRRNKWQKRTVNIKVDDIVLVRHDNLPPTQWRMGRVTAVHPGSDGIVRNVTLRTSSGCSTRAVQKLCRLLDPEGFESGDPTGQDVNDASLTC